jgi:hypothetical protein
MATRTELDAVFLKLKAILEPYAPRLAVVTDTGSDYYLDTRYIMKNKKPLFFGSVRRGKSGVSFHLMPLYMYADLLDGVSPELKKHLQGKSCLNFTSVDEKLFKELARVTKAGFARYRTEKYV